MIRKQVEHLQYLKQQILLLALHARRDTDDPEMVEAIDQKAAAIREVLHNPLPPNDVDGKDVFEILHEAHTATLCWLSSLVDKSKPGGWIADRSAVYRVEKSGREYRNTDLIIVQMANRDYSGAVGAHARAREVATALNSLA